MRRYIKKEILEIIKTLSQAIIQIQQLLDDGEAEALQNLLADCQEAAIGIGNAIEQAEGEGTDAVAGLTEYCELLYLLLMGEHQDTTRLEACLERIIIQVKALPEKLEVLFLPYKASMWDSLESVWMAAAEDEQCNAYVVPIPYFDKNSDGTLGNMYYEGNQLPDYVPVIDWRSYDIAGRKPDIIYIHNPYDQYNYVTSVHPAFYSAELKKHTDLLVYIPYFVSQNAVAEHFCRTPGVIWADKVIVQSKGIANTYKRIYMEMMGEEQLKKEVASGVRDEAFWERLRQQADEKFLALGSPKFDKVHNATREDAEQAMPREWADKLYTTDEHGCRQRRKVFLYNTSIQALLDNREQAIAKLQSVFRFFKSRPELLLLWRPHPLNESTIKSITPQLMEAYRQLIAEYKAEGWGIYDDTADLHRSIALSDAYYGDGGSVPVLYRETGKPIMIQNYNVLEDEV